MSPSREGQDWLRWVLPLSRGAGEELQEGGELQQGRPQPYRHAEEKDGGRQLNRSRAFTHYMHELTRIAAVVDEHEYDHQGKDEEQVIDQQIGKSSGS